ncbi:MAG: bifunctional pyr operon transcriptional regulator/uracil phosphoribosyltransferase PyrR [Bacteroidota bacterium]|jgi:pyrimidine operon attenuation protein/uracil phosphoribosyltransferase
MEQKTILDAAQLQLTLRRLAHQIFEQHPNFMNTILIGIQPRGVSMAIRLVETIKQEFNIADVPFGVLDVSYYRDDVHRDSTIKSYTSKIDISLENKNVVLIDDVLYTGRTVRSALDAMLAYGRPQKVELCVLIDRKFSRHLPVQADYVGKAIDSHLSQKVKVKWIEQDDKDEILLLN